MTAPNDIITRADQVAFSGPVFRDFTAKLANIDFPVITQKPKAVLQFTEMVTHKAIASYPHPVGEIVMNRTSGKGGAPSDRGPWGYILISANAQGYPDIVELVGHTVRIRAKENPIAADVERGTEAGSFLTWDIIEVDGEDHREPDDDTTPTAVSATTQPEAVAEDAPKG